MNATSAAVAFGFVVACGPTPIEVVRPTDVRSKQPTSELDVRPTDLSEANFNALNYMPADTVHILQVNGESLRRSPHLQKIIADLKGAAVTTEIRSLFNDVETWLLNTVNVTVGMTAGDTDIGVVVTGNYEVVRLQRILTKVFPDTKRRTRADGMARFSAGELLVQQIDATHWLVSSAEHSEGIRSLSVPKQLSGLDVNFGPQNALRGWMPATDGSFGDIFVFLNLQPADLEDMHFFEFRLALDEENGFPAHIEYRYECSSDKAATRLHKLMVANKSDALVRHSAPARYRLEGSAAIIVQDVSAAEVDDAANRVKKQIARTFRIDVP